MKKVVYLPTLFSVFVLLALFPSCNDDYGDTAAPIQWKSSTHTIKMKNKYTHYIFLDASAATIQLNCVNYSYPYITVFTDPDSTSFYNGPGYSSYADIPGKESYYFIDTHEQHISRPTIKVDLKDSIMTVAVKENTSANQRMYHISVDDSEQGYPSNGFISIFQAGKKP